jgi:hypothetical protein
MEIKDAAHWESLREAVSPGDLFFTKGKGLFSHLISCRSPVAHVGMLLRYGDRIFGLDSTTGGTRGGVDIFNFSSLFHPLKGKVYLLPLSHTREAIQSFYDDAKALTHQPYEKQKWKLARFYFGMTPPRGEDSIFCSELIVRMLNHAYKMNYVPHMYHPKHLFYQTLPLGELLSQLSRDVAQ